MMPLRRAPRKNASYIVEELATGLLLDRESTAPCGNSRGCNPRLALHDFDNRYRVQFTTRSDGVAGGPRSVWDTAVVGEDRDFDAGTWPQIRSLDGEARSLLLDAESAITNLIARRDGLVTGTAERNQRQNGDD